MVKDEGSSVTRSWFYPSTELTDYPFSLSDPVPSVSLFLTCVHPTCTFTSSPFYTSTVTNILTFLDTHVHSDTLVTLPNI